MCRFLLAKSTNPILPSTLLYPFSAMAKKSKAFDGDWQGDGWGLSWTDSNNMFHVHTSLYPIWEEDGIFDSFTETKNLSLHARSASFTKHKGNILFNQPYINTSYSFVFNGLLKKVSLNISGQIGAIKIWNLFQQNVAQHNPIQALELLKNQLISNAKEIQALNVGIQTLDHIYALCYFTKHPHYYQLHYVNTPKIKIISSQPFAEHRFQSVESGTILSL